MFQRQPSSSARYRMVDLEANSSDVNWSGKPIEMAKSLCRAREQGKGGGWGVFINSDVRGHVSRGRSAMLSHLSGV